MNFKNLSAMFWKTISLSLLLILIGGCSGNTANSVSLEAYPLPISESISWLEQEHTVTLHSYYGPSVREAETEDILTRINAVYLDLENGEMSEDSADIYYRLTCGSMCFPLWIAINGAIIQDAGEEMPTFEECVQILPKAGDKVFGYSSLYTTYGRYACIRTKNNRVGWIRYEQDFLSNLEKGDSQITYWIWDKVISD